MTAASPVTGSFANTGSFDLVVRGGTVVNHAGRALSDVGIRNG